MKIPISSELNPSTGVYDFVEFDALLEVNIGIYHQLFAEHKIWIDTEFLASEHCGPLDCFC